MIEKDHWRIKSKSFFNDNKGKFMKTTNQLSIVKLYEAN